MGVLVMRRRKRNGGEDSSDGGGIVGIFVFQRTSLDSLLGRPKCFNFFWENRYGNISHRGDFFMFIAP